VQVANSGNVIVSARLTNGNGNEIQSVSNTSYLYNNQTNTMLLRFNGTLIHDSLMNGPYLLKDLYIYHTGDPEKSIYLGNPYNTTAYSYTEFTGSKTLSATANRTLPDTALAGSRINVTIKLDVNESNKLNSVIIKDYFPAGWNVTSSAPAANSIANGEIKWILYGDSVSDQTISYILKIPLDVIGYGTFSGEIIYNNEYGKPINVPIGGDSFITIQTENCSVKGDSNCDNKVSDFELLAYVDKWVKGEVGDFDLLDAINTWASA